MMLLFSLFGLALATSSARSGWSPFQEYVQELGKVYSDAEYAHRESIFRHRLGKVKEHNEVFNQGGSTWFASVDHQLGDASDEELRQLLGLQKSLGRHAEASGKFLAQKVGASAAVANITSGTTTMKPKPSYTPLPLPRAIDWRDTIPAVVTPVKNQGGCGSCWAFSATEVIESAAAIATGVLFDLSPQQLVSCVDNPHKCGGSGGCEGATVNLALNYTQNVAGLKEIWTNPYRSGTSETPECPYNTSQKARRRSVAAVTDYENVPRNDPAGLLSAVLTGPVSISVDASTWWMYGGGIFDGCNTKNPDINHAVVLDGYGEENGTKFWLVRNSWGPLWGENGYIRIKRYDVGEEPCGWDLHPGDGYACEDEADIPVLACGMCGILSDSWRVTGVSVPGFDGPRKNHKDTAGRRLAQAEVFV